MRADRYDIIGMGLLVFVAALWVLHFTLPAPPPDTPDTPAAFPGLPP